MARKNSGASRFHWPFLPLPRRCGIRPTFAGFVYLGMLMALLLGSINHNNNLGYLLTFFLAGLLLVSLRQGFLNVLDMTVSSIRAEPAFAGGKARIFVQIVPGHHSHFALWLALSTEHPAPLDNLLAKETRQLEIALPLARRGLLPLPPLEITSTFPFGLVECRHFVPVKATCLAYPKPRYTPFISRALTGEEEHPEQHEQAARLAGHDFSGISPYKPGDSLNRIHWKSLARGQGLHVTEFEEENSGGAYFALAAMPGRDLEHKLSRLCHLVLLASSRDLRFGLDLGALCLAPDHGTRHRLRCLEALALYGTNPSGGNHA